MNDTMIRTTKMVAKDNGIELSDAEAKKHTEIILRNTEDYYRSGDRQKSTRDDDFYYDCKSYFGG